MSPWARNPECRQSCGCNVYEERSKLVEREREREREKEQVREKKVH